MKVQLITPEKILFEGDAEMVTAPGTEGDFGALPGHSPLISTLRSGVITIDLVGGEKREVAITGGVAEVTPDHATFLIEAA
jgi:F-type H+-transporting ATPase subunit epsilon